MNTKKQIILEMMKKLNLSTDIIEEYEEGNFLPYEKVTLDKACNAIKKMLRIDDERKIYIYDEIELLKINKLYKELSSMHIIYKQKAPYQI